jgi:hypothetical protein
MKFVNIGGEPRPIKFGFNALMEFGDITNRTVDAINKINPASLTMRDLLTLCWCALKQGARKEQVAFDATIEDIGDWMDDNPNAMVEIVAEYAKSQSADPKEVKKNPPAKKSR